MTDYEKYRVASFRELMLVEGYPDPDNVSDNEILRLLEISKEMLKEK